ncbi:MAG: DNA topoisomerase VI subunit B [Verrucomicrobia bacterium]|nr:DNA topoisomerase VI subunit B [Verrucomicrobiota bacterium]
MSQTAHKHAKKAGKKAPAGKKAHEEKPKPAPAAPAKPVAAASDRRKGKEEEKRRSETAATAEPPPAATPAAEEPKNAAEVMAKKQRDISVSEFFLKNRHLLGFDNARKALLTTVKEAVDNSLDACEEAGILPEVWIELIQVSENRYRVIITDNGPGIVKAQIPKVFAKLLYGSKFHRLRMSRGQQGIGISAAGMYGQLTTGVATKITSKIGPKKKAHYYELQIDTRKNEPHIVKDDEVNWDQHHGTRVEIELEATYQRGRQSVDEYIQACAIANPHVTFRYRLWLLPKEEKPAPAAENTGGASAHRPSTTSSESGHSGPSHIPEKEPEWMVFERGAKQLPAQPQEIKPHPHGIELGMLMQMLKNTSARNIRSFLHSEFSRVSDRVALEICQHAGVEPKSRPSNVAFRESENLFKAINDTKLMNPPLDCLSPIGEEQLLAGLKKEVDADFYDAVTRPPSVYRGNPFQIELALAYKSPGKPKGEERNNESPTAEEPIRLLRFANRVPLLYQQGACSITKAVQGVDWKNYGLSQPRGQLPMGPLTLLVHMASVWVPFTSESKEALAGYDEILREITLGLQELGRHLSVYLSRRRRDLEAQRKRDYMQLYVPHLALGLKQILGLGDKDEQKIITKLKTMLERTHLQT